MNAARTANAASKGFTLIEVMLAIMLFAVLLAGAWGAIHTAVKAMHSGESAIDRTDRLRAAQQFVRREVSHILPLAYARDDNTGTQYVFEGAPNAITFVAAMPGYLSRGGPYVQSLRLVGGQLVFADAMLNGYDPSVDLAKANPPVVLLDQIQDGHFEFRTYDDQGQLTDWLDTWDDPGITPVMVRLVINMRPEARVTFPVMDIPLRIDAQSSRRGRPVAGAAAAGGSPSAGGSVVR